uniref:efflux RND transporter permease subunit n=1 Tax=Natronospira sp. TaxID=2024970 RepID=UPI003872BD9B
FDPSQDAIWEAGFSSTVRSETEVRDWVEHQLAPQLLSIHGVSGVEAAGGQVREMSVTVDQERLQSYGLTMQHLITALEGENVDIAAGWVTSDTFDVMAKTDGLFRSAEDIRNVLLQLPDNDRRIRLSEVAEVRDGYGDQRLFVRLNGVEAAQVSVFKIPEANTVEVVDEITATMDRLERTGFLPADIQYESTRDPTYFIRGSISSVGAAAILGGVLAMSMVLLFLGSLRKSFVIGLSIPLALMATFAMMGASGLTLNIMSLGGLALGVGLLLDNGIVMLENIFRHRDELGKEPEDAAHDGSREVASAITAGTLTNLAAVVPFLLMTGMAALVFRELILTISFAILATLAAALTLIPMLAALLARVRFESGLSRTRLIRGFNAAVDGLRDGYRAILPGVLRWRWGVLGLAVLGLAGASHLSGQLGNTFLPQVDDGNVGVFMGLPPGTPPHENDAATRQIEALIDDMPHVESVFTRVGGHLSGGVISERPGTSRLSIQLVPAVDREMSAGEWVQEAQSRLDELDIPGARLVARPPSIPGLRFSVAGTDLSIGIVGEDLEELNVLARELVAQLDGIEGLEGVEVGREDQSPLLRIRVDRERAADLGLNVSDVGNAIRNAVDGAVPTRFVTGQTEYDVRIRLPESERSNPESLGGMMLSRPDGQPVLLRDVAEFEFTEGPAHIERENQNRLKRVNGDINTEIRDIGSVMADVEARLAEMDFPDHISLLVGGQWETIQDTNRELLTVILLALFLVFVVLAVQYERLSNPLVILSAAPLALMGVVGILWLTDNPLSAPVMIGVILLIGVVVNNAILLVEYIEIGRREQQLPVDRAIVEAGAVRLRPILMTTTTTVLGMTPLAIGLGEGAEIMQALALSVIGGLLMAMLLTLFVVPCLYLVVSRFSEHAKAWLTGGRYGEAGG